MVDKYNKIQYAPGGSTDREEYQPKIPSISACCFDEELGMLMVSFVDCDTKCFTLKGIDNKNQLETI